jgi:plasmid stability protein
MKQLTVRGFDEELEARLREVAEKEGVSLNKAVLTLLRRGAGMSEEGPASPVIGRSLDPFIGTWSEDQEKEFLDSVRVFEQVDEAFWS